MSGEGTAYMGIACARAKKQTLAGLETMAALARMCLDDVDALIETVVNGIISLKDAYLSVENELFDPHKLQIGVY
jgi:hypothetical protein